MADEIKTVLDVAPAYINFTFSFFRSPRNALKSYSGIGKVNSDLTSLLLGGVAASYVSALLLAPSELSTDSGNVVRLLRRLGSENIPIATLGFVLFGAIALHATVKSIAGIGRRVGGEQAVTDFSGRIEDTINAAFAFSAIFVPFTTACFLASFNLYSIIASEAVLTVGTLVVGLSIAIGVYVYFPLCLSAVHAKTTLPQAAWAVGIGFTALGVLIYFATSLFQFAA